MRLSPLWDGRGREIRRVRETGEMGRYDRTLKDDFIDWGTHWYIYMDGIKRDKSIYRKYLFILGRYIKKIDFLPHFHIFLRGEHQQFTYKFSLHEMASWRERLRCSQLTPYISLRNSSLNFCIDALMYCIHAHAHIYIYIYHTRRHTFDWGHERRSSVLNLAALLEWKLW